MREGKERRSLLRVARNEFRLAARFALSPALLANATGKREKDGKKEREKAREQSSRSIVNPVGRCLPTIDLA